MSSLSELVGKALICNKRGICHSNSEGFMPLQRSWGICLEHLALFW